MKKQQKIISIFGAVALLIAGTLAVTAVINFASIGDFVWHDLDNDGIQDAGEPGIPGVTVNLYDGAGIFLATTATDSNGYYLFDELFSGDYYVEFILLPGYVFSPQDQGMDDAMDSDADQTTGQAIVTHLDWGEHDMTWDAGMYQPQQFEGCTPGYWKNHLEDWPPTGYVPGQAISSVFTIPSELSELAGDSLLDALNYGGGKELLGAAQNLLRHSVAALLNSAHPDVNTYPLSESEVIAQVNAALTSLDKDTIENLKDDLDLNNNYGGCLCD